jgi:hypothetical protein
VELFILFPLAWLPALLLGLVVCSVGSALFAVVGLLAIAVIAAAIYALGAPALAVFALLGGALFVAAASYCIGRDLIRWCKSTPGWWRPVLFALGCLGVFLLAVRILSDPTVSALLPTG